MSSLILRCVSGGLCNYYFTDLCGFLSCAVCIILYLNFCEISTIQIAQRSQIGVSFQFSPWRRGGGFFGFCFIDRGFMTAPEFRLLNVLPRTGWLSGVFWQQRLPDCVSAYPFFFLRRKKNLKKKELQGGCPLDPRCGERHHNRMRYQRDGSVQVAQRGQIKARTVKHPAAN